MFLVVPYLARRAVMLTQTHHRHRDLFLLELLHIIAHTDYPIYLAIYVLLTFAYGTDWSYSCTYVYINMNITWYYQGPVVQKMGWVQLRLGSNPGLANPVGLTLLFKRRVGLGWLTLLLSFCLVVLSFTWVQSACAYLHFRIIRAIFKSLVRHPR